MAANTRYTVFLDSNGIRDKNYIKEDLRLNLEKAKKHRFISVEFMLPQIVQEEWLYHYEQRAKVIGLNPKDSDYVS